MRLGRKVHHGVDALRREDVGDKVCERRREGGRQSPHWALPTIALAAGGAPARPPTHQRTGCRP